MGEEEGFWADAEVVLGSSAKQALPRILERYSRDVVARALREAARTPEDRIRKTRAALFRYLLGKLSRAKGA